MWSTLLRQLQLLKFDGKDSQSLSRSGTLRRSGAQGWKTLRKNVKKSDIGKPKDFRHVQHYNKRRNTVIFPDSMSSQSSLNEKWDAQTTWHGEVEVKVAEVHFVPKPQYQMASPPRRKPVPSLYDPVRPVLPLELRSPCDIPLPASPTLSASEDLGSLENDEMELGRAL